MPRVSVVTAAYNMSPYLHATIDSVLSQDYPDFEFIILDDGSTDDSAAIIKSYGDRVRYHYQENAGVADACNLVMSLARGEYIHLLDADDMLLPGALSRLVPVLDRHPTAAFAYGDAQIIDSTGEITGKRLAPRWMQDSELVPSEKAFRELLRGCHITNSAVMIRKSIVESMPGFRADAVPGEDWDFWLRITSGHDIAYTPHLVAAYRHHNSSITSKYTVDWVIDSHFRTLDRLFYEPDFRYKHMRRYAYACVERTIARVAARLRHRLEFASYFADAVRRSPSLAREGVTYTVALEGMKSLLPQPLISAGKQVKRAARAFGVML